MSLESDRVSTAESTSECRPDIDLSLAVVEYSDGPDRCTIYPPGLSGDAHLSTWLSVDRSLVVDLGEMR